MVLVPKKKIVDKRTVLHFQWQKHTNGEKQQQKLYFIMAILEEKQSFCLSKALQFQFLFCNCIDLSLDTLFR
jgi:hypothetical protein